METNDLNSLKQKAFYESDPNAMRLLLRKLQDQEDVTLLEMCIALWLEGFRSEPVVIGSDLEGLVWTSISGEVSEGTRAAYSKFARL